MKMLDRHADLGQVKTVENRKSKIVKSMIDDSIHLNIINI